jgi:hypothetical protein
MMPPSQLQWYHNLLRSIVDQLPTASALTAKCCHQLRLPPDDFHQVMLKETQRLQAREQTDACPATYDRC